MHDNGVGLIEDANRAVVRTTMSKHVGVLRKPEGLQTAIDTLAAVASQSGSNVVGTRRNFEATNILTVATAVAAAALARTESRGCHRRTDTPEQRDEWKRHLSVSIDGASLMIAGIPAEG
jgi:L-aspartate oxidase